MFLLKNKFPEYYAYQGRKTSKKISLPKKKLISQFYNQNSYDEYIIGYYKNKNKKQKINISQNFNKINIEIGFGNGEFLIKRAISNPNELFIGIEVYINGIAKVLSTISDLGLNNIILSHLNGYYFLKAMPYKSVDKVFIINPDPWIKKRHNKRRLLSYETMLLLTRIVKSKYSIYMTTDSECYLRDIERLLCKYEDLLGEYKINILSKNEELYGVSRYQRKAIEKGKNIYLLTF